MMIVTTNNDTDYSTQEKMDHKQSNSNDHAPNPLSENKKDRNDDDDDDNDDNDMNSNQKKNSSRLNNASNTHNHESTPNDDNSSSTGTSCTNSGTMSRASSPDSVESYNSSNDSHASVESLAIYEEEEEEVEDVCVASLLPSYLEGFVQHSHQDFFVSPYFDPQLLAQLMCEGFLPISTSRYLLPKLHEERCVIYPLQQQQQQTQNEPCKLPPVCKIHTSKSTKKKLKKFTFTINQDFDGVVRGCHAQHGVAWLYPKIVASFKYIHELSKPTNTTKVDNRREQGRGIIARLFPPDDSHHNHSKSQQTVSGCDVKLYSIEVWNQETGELAGGELGYTIGTIYTSLTGFSSQDSAGSVQLATLGKILCLSGYEMWDLGMSLDYKIHLGASMMERMNFVNCVKEMRVKHPSQIKAGGKELKCDERINCKEIFDMDEWIQ